MFQPLNYMVGSPDNQSPPLGAIQKLFVNIQKTPLQLSSLKDSMVLVVRYGKKSNIYFLLKSQYHRETERALQLCL